MFLKAYSNMKEFPRKAYPSPLCERLTQEDTRFLLRNHALSRKCWVIRPEYRVCSERC